MTNAILSWKPTEKQMAFLNDTGSMKVASCSNWAGKSTMLAFETACHLTGIYPVWWAGKRFGKRINAVVVGANFHIVRDALQDKIADFIGDGLRRCKFRHGIFGAFDRIVVDHVDGGTSELLYLNNEMTTDMFRRGSIDFAAIDEQIDTDKLIELRLRAAVADGVVSTAFTPLDVNYYNLLGGSANPHIIGMTDCPWINAENVAKATQWFPKSGVDARLNGLVVEAKDE